MIHCTCWSAAPACRWRATRPARLIARAPLATSRFLRPLVAVDLAELSRPAIEAAAALVEPGASIELVHVIDAGELSPTDLADAASRARLETLEKLHRFVREIDVATVPIETRAKLGRVADRILEAAAIGHRDLIAIGARRRDNPDAVLGTIADRVLRCATVPVLIVPPTD
jgi:nucleotide-binding universal stress UspA family protein